MESGVSTICLLVVSLLVWKMCHWIYRWGNPKCSGQLPPGSMGFPIIGETAEFLKLHDFHRISPFLEKRVSRYGPLFRTSLFGSKVVISTDAEVNMEISKANECFGDGAFQSIRQIFGEKNLFMQNKVTHKCTRNLMFQLIGPEGLKRDFLQDIDLTTSKLIQSGVLQGSFDAIDMAKDIVSECLTKKIKGDMEPEAARVVGEIPNGLPNGWFRFPFPLPGTALHKFIKARKKAMKVLEDTFREKKRSKEGLRDFLGTILEETEKESAFLDAEQAAQFVFTLLLLSQETIPSATASVLKLIADHPKVMQELQKEHRRIIQNRTDKNEGLTWEEYKSMSFTHMVINESLRISSTVPTMFMRTKCDIEIRGYTIPAGWFIMGAPLVHFDPEKYEDPFTFNPWRWEGRETHSNFSKTYMPFGGGSRMCVGAEFAKLQIAIYIHHLSLYKWRVKEETRVLRRFVLKFPNGCIVETSEAVDG